MNTWSLLTFAATAVAWAMAVLVLKTGRGPSARRLALLLLVEGTAVITTETGVLQWVSTATVANTISLIHVAADFGILTLYLPFLASAINVTWLQPFRTTTGRAIVSIVGLAGMACVFAFPDAFITDTQGLAPATYVRWVFGWGSIWAVPAIGLVLVFTLAIIASVRAWKDAETDLVRRRAAVFMWAFGTRDLVWASIYLVAAFANDSLSIRGLAILLQVYAGSLLIYSLLIGYGILTTQLFDIDLKLRWTIKQGTVAAVFLAMFFLVSELATTFLSDYLGKVVGVAASALLVFAMAPLQQLGERLARSALPNVSNTTEYSSYRKLQIYASALEAAYQDGGVTDRERKMLARLCETLGLQAQDASQLENDIVARWRGAQ